ncbi:hypothetical protein JNUCC64_14615 [Streptomyces sp. JNUCC 64]
MVPQHRVEQLVRLSRTPAGRLALGAVAVAVVAVAGCSAAGAPGHDPVEGADVRPLSGVTHFSHESGVRLHDRVEEAVATCMSGRGFRYTPVVANASPRSAGTNPYGLLTPGAAAADGYGIVGEFLHRRRNPSPTGAVPPGQDGERHERWKESLLGTPDRRVSEVLPDGRTVEYSPDGCAFRASEEVYGPGWGVLRASVEQLSGRVLKGVENDPAYRASVRRWSVCMADAGRPAPALRTLRDAVAARVDDASGDLEALKRLGAAEIADATADASCQREVRLAERIGEIQNRLEPGLLKPEDRRLVDRFDALKRAALQAVSRSAPDGERADGPPE